MGNGFSTNDTNSLKTQPIPFTTVHELKYWWTACEMVAITLNELWFRLQPSTCALNKERILPFSTSWYKIHPSFDTSNEMRMTSTEGTLWLFTIGTRLSTSTQYIAHTVFVMALTMPEWSFQFPVRLISLLTHSKDTDCCFKPKWKRPLLHDGLSSFFSTGSKNAHINAYTRVWFVHKITAFNERFKYWFDECIFLLHSIKGFGL